MLLILCTIAGTYAVIIKVSSEEGIDKIVNEIDIIDLLTNDDKTYNKTYYDVKNEINITDEEMTLLINSEPLNKLLDEILITVVDYKLHNNISARLSNDALYDKINNAVYETNTIDDNLKKKTMDACSKYKQDISDYVYDIEVSRIN